VPDHPPAVKGSAPPHLSQRAAWCRTGPTPGPGDRANWWPISTP
jgi:hypothetical protein